MELWVITNIIKASLWQSLYTDLSINSECLSVCNPPQPLRVTDTDRTYVPTRLFDSCLWAAQRRTMKGFLGDTCMALTWKKDEKRKAACQQNSQSTLKTRKYLPQASFQGQTGNVEHWSFPSWQTGQCNAKCCIKITKCCVADWPTGVKDRVLKEWVLKTEMS